MKFLQLLCVKQKVIKGTTTHIAGLHFSLRGRERKKSLSLWLSRILCLSSICSLITTSVQHIYKAPLMSYELFCVLRTQWGCEQTQPLLSWSMRSSWGKGFIKNKLRNKQATRKQTNWIGVKREISALVPTIKMCFIYNLAQIVQTLCVPIFPNHTIGDNSPGR